MIASGQISVSSSSSVDAYGYLITTSGPTPDYNIRIQNTDPTYVIYFNNGSFVGNSGYQINPGKEVSFDITAGDRIYLQCDSTLGGDALARIAIFTK